MVKGNADRVIKVGKMPGRLQDIAVDSSTTYAEALEIAEVDASGYEVKADGTKVTDLDAPVGSTNLVLLTKMVKGNK
jgi:hypothetical protein